MTRSFSIPWAIMFAVICFAAIAAMPSDAEHLPSMGELWWLLIPSVLLGIPFAVWLPHACAGAMGDSWRVPRRTLLMPRWLVCFVGTQMIGMSIGSFALCVVTDIRYGLLCIMHSVGTTAFVLSANYRFARHPKSEFVMPSPFPYPLRKRM